jgi:hypothetical protein
MGILATDILIKTMIEGALADLRKNNWILDDIFADLANDPLARLDYGHKEIQRAREWFLGNNIDVYLVNRVDTPRFPCITVVRTSSREMTERDSLADIGSEEDFDPIDITKQIQVTYTEFTPKAYNKQKGLFTLPDNIDTTNMLPGQYLVSKRSSKAYVINAVLGPKAFLITPGIDDDFTNAYVVPPTALWNLNKELTFLEEQFAIGLHAESDLNQAIWLRQIAQYIFLRYKEAYLERRGFELSTFTLGSIDENPHFNGAERVYSCSMSLSGQVEANFIKYAAPKIQGIKGGIRIIDGPRTPDEYQIYAQSQGWKMEEDP